MPQYVRALGGNLFILFFGFGYKELKVGREYMVNVFNGLLMHDLIIDFDK